MLRWHRLAALLVNEVTLLPAVLPLTPAPTLLDRLLTRRRNCWTHTVCGRRWWKRNAQWMTECRLMTANRSMVGVLGEFAALADIGLTERHDMLRMSLRLATTPCGPLYRRHVSPNWELAALFAGMSGPGMSSDG